MPELPEVHTTLCAISPYLKVNTIKEIEVLRSNMIKDDSGLMETVIGAKVQKLERKGKYMLVFFETGTCMVIHLKISGRLGVRTASEDQLTYERIRIVLSNNSLLVFNDPRTLGRLYFLPTESVASFKPLVVLGPDALETKNEYFYQRLRKRTIPIKQVLLDQSFVAGIGNIYADEACFDAGIDPRRPAKNLTKNEALSLNASVKKALEKGIKNMGTSISDFADLFGKPGQNQSQLLAYGRGGEQCISCGNTMRRTAINNRGTTWCSHCQR